MNSFVVIFESHWIDFAASPVAVTARAPFVVSAVSPIVHAAAAASLNSAVTVDHTRVVEAAFAPRRIRPEIDHDFVSVVDSVPLRVATIVPVKDIAELFESTI
jgi:hypothetical protein